MNKYFYLILIFVLLACNSETNNEVGSDCSTEDWTWAESCCKELHARNVMKIIRELMWKLRVLQLG